MKFALTLLLLAYNSASGLQIRGYDCEDEGSEVVTVGTTKVENCLSDDDHERPKYVYVQVLKEAVSKPVLLKGCRIIQSHLVTHCGMHSHASILPKGLSVGIISDMTAQTCDDIHQRGSYKTSYGHTISGIRVNATTHAQLTDVGTVNSDGSCKGNEFTLNGQTYQDAVLSTHYDIKAKEVYARMQMIDSVVILPTGERCAYLSGVCTSDDGFSFYWIVREARSVCGPKSYINLYEGWGNITESKTAPLVLTVETPDKRFALALTEQTPLCGFVGYKSMKDDVVVITGPPMSLPYHDSHLDVYNADVFTDMDIKFVYLERNIMNRTTDLYTLFSKRYCKLNRQHLMSLLSISRMSPEEFAWLYMEGKTGYTALTRGEVIHIIKCVEKNVTVRITEECFNEIPVTYQNKSLFVKPANRILVSIGSQIPCTPLAPVLYNLQSRWVRLGGDPALAETPIQLSPNPSLVWEYGGIVSLKNIGFLSTKQINDYKRAILNPIERQAVSDVFYGSVTNRGPKILQGLNFNNAFDTDQIVDNVSSKVINKLYGVWDFLIQYLGAICGAALVWDFTLGLLSVITNGILLYKKYGCSSLLFFALWSTGAKHILYGDLRVKRFPWSKSKILAPDSGNRVDQEALAMIEVMDESKAVSKLPSNDLYPSLKDTTASYL